MAARELGQARRHAGGPLGSGSNLVGREGWRFLQLGPHLPGCLHSLLALFYCAEMHTTFTLVAFSVSSTLYNLHHYLVPDILIPSKGDPTPLSSHSPPPLFGQLLATTNLSSISTDLPVLHISHQWAHTTRGLVCLASSASMFSRFIRVVVCV